MVAVGQTYWSEGTAWTTAQTRHAHESGDPGAATLQPTLVQPVQDARAAIGPAVGLVAYYRCTHKNKEQRCEARNFIRQEQLEEEVKRNTQLVVIPDEWEEKFLTRIETWESKVSQ